MIALLTGVLLDLLIGDPYALPHPVRLIGRLVSYLEKLLYREGTREGNIIRGALLFVITVFVTLLVSFTVL